VPHAVIEGEIDLESWARVLRPILLRRGADVLRTDQVYLERGGRAVLLEALVVEAGRKTPFYIRIGAHDRGSFTVRVDPMTHPDRSEGVRELVAAVAGALVAFAPGARVARSNVVITSDPSVEERTDENRE
jgi:hypothetical protein